MNDMNCQLNIPEITGLTSQQITVGRHFILNCDGLYNSEIELGKLKLISDQDTKYDIQLNKITPTKAGFGLDCVSYKVGELKNKSFILSDGKNQITVNLQNLKIDSVLDPQKMASEKPQEPYGFIVAKLDWPLAYTVIIGLFICAVIAINVTWVLRKRKMILLIKSLKEYDSVNSPESQFYKNMRLLEKENYSVISLYKYFNIYIMRKLQIPVLGLTLNHSIQVMKKKWPTLVTERRDLKNIFNDLEKLNQNAKNISQEDIKKYLNKIYHFVDHLENKFMSDELNQKGSL